MTKGMFRNGLIFGILFILISSCILPNLSTPVNGQEPLILPLNASKEIIKNYYTNLLQTNKDIQQFIRILSQNNSNQWVTFSVGIIGIQLLFPPKLPRIIICPRGFILGIFTYRMDGYTVYTQADDIINMTVVNGTHGVYIKNCFGYSANLRPRIAGLGGGFIAVSPEKPAIIQRH